MTSGACRPLCPIFPASGRCSGRRTRQCVHDVNYANFTIHAVPCRWEGGKSKQILQEMLLLVLVCSIHQQTKSVSSPLWQYLSVFLWLFSFLLPLGYLLRQTPEFNRQNRFNEVLMHSLVERSVSTNTWTIACPHLWCSCVIARHVLSCATHWGKVCCVCGGLDVVQLPELMYSWEVFLCFSESFSGELSETN